MPILEFRNFEQTPLKIEDEFINVSGENPDLKGLVLDLRNSQEACCKLRSA